MIDLPFVIYGADECGPDGYPFAWHNAGSGRGVKHFVREAAGDRCERCKHPYRKGAGEWSSCDEQCAHGSPVEVWAGGMLMCSESQPMEIADVHRQVVHGHGVYARWRILTVHHLNGAKNDCRWWNLAALCQRCHLAIQGKVQMDRVWIWEHSDWFKPHAAGWYAAAYLDEDLDRNEVMDRLDELLELERQESAS